MKVNNWISRRLKLSQASGRRSSAGVVIAVIGVAISLMIMELTLGIVLGFKHEIRQKVMGFESQVIVEPRYLDADGRTDDTISLSPRLLQTIRTTMPGSTVSLTLRQPAVLKTPDQFSAVVFTARDARHDFGFERSMITDGAWPDYTVDSLSNHIVISRTMADQLGLKVGDRVDAAFFVSDNIKARRYTVGGIYASNIGEYDATVAFCNLPMLQRVARLDSLTGSSVDISGIPLPQVDTAAKLLSQRLLQQYYQASAKGQELSLYPVDTVLRRGSLYFNWLSLLDTNVVVIFVLMLCVAAFTLIASQFMIVLERIPTIGLLRTLGASRSRVRRIFQLMALRLTLPGMLVGNLLGIGAMLFQYHTRLLRLDPQMYYLDHVPVQLSWTGLLLINLGVALLSWLVLIIPAVAASKVDPAVTVKYE